jgi:3-hydroxy-3-methylglutaryl CoA synthase
MNAEAPPLIDSRAGFVAAIAWGLRESMALDARRIVCADCGGQKGQKLRAVRGRAQVVKHALRLEVIPRHVVGGGRVKHACLGGIYALKSAVRFLSTDGDDSLAIVVCSDKALYERGSSGEPTQGAGAVAMLLESTPRLASINLRHAGTASEYRGIDFRKPLTGRLNGHAYSLDIPVYNGRYSTNCYVDEVRGETHR